MKKFNKILSVGLSLAMCASMVAPAFAATFSELQGVIDNQASLYVKDSEGNDTEDVRIGYDEGKITLNEDVTRGDDEANKSITISGEDTDVTIDLNGYDIDGADKAGSVIKVTDGASLTIKDSGENGTITGGNTQFGGGVNVSDHASFTMEGGTISGNTSTAEGGGVYVIDGSTFTMNGGEISDNTAKNSGGGVFVHNYAGEDHSQFVMDGGKITENTTGNTDDGTGAGGGVAAYGDKQNNAEAAVIINKGEITGNVTGGDGGGIAVQNGALAMNGGTVSDNEAGEYGSGVYIYDSDASIKGATITGNSGAANGGGIYAGVGGDVELSGNTISGNSANYGGGVYAGGENVNVTMTGNTISGNSANYGGGVGVYNTTIDMEGNTISGNTAAYRGGGVYASAGNAGSTTVNMDGDTVSENKVTGTNPYGGGIFASENGADTTVNLNNVIIVKNEAEQGGGIFIWGANVNMEGGSITKNNASSSGGGVRLYNGASFIMSDGKIYSNTADGYAADVHSASGSKVTLVPASSMGVTGEDGKAITGWYFDGSSGNRWSTGKYPYVSQDAFTTGNSTGTLCLKAAHDEYFNVVYTDGRGNDLWETEAENNTGIPMYTGEIPSRPGYSFGGWLLDGSSVDWENGIVNGALILEPLWILVPVADDPDETDPGDVTIGETAIPLASGPITRAEFIDYLWRHEGEPASDGVCSFTDVPADHEYVLALAWAEQNGVAAAYEDGSFEPDELVTVAAVREFLGNFAQSFGVAMPELTALTGDDDEAVINCAEVVAEFFGEEYIVPSQDEDLAA